MLRNIFSTIKRIIFTIQQVLIFVVRYLYYLLLILLVLNCARFHGPRFLAARYILSRFYTLVRVCKSTREYSMINKYIHKSSAIRTLRRYFWPIL